MSQQLDLKEIERQLYRATLQDGLTELFLGIYMMVVGAAVAANIAFVAVVILFGSVWLKRIIEPIKRRYVYPRMGYVSFRAKTEQQTTKKWVVAAVMGILLAYVAFLIGTFALTTQAMGYQAGRAFWYSRIPTAIAGILIAAALLILALRYGTVIRWYVYAALALIGGFAVPYIPGLPSGSEGFPILIGIQFAGLGIIAAIIGLIVFLYFIKTNPVLEEEIPDGSN